MFEEIVVKLIDINKLIIIISIIFAILGSLISVAYFTLFERKVMAAMQRRRGPNVVGVYGLLQPLADGLKLMVKEGIMPSMAIVNVYLIAPILSVTVSFLGWSILPIFNLNVLSINSDFDMLLFLFNNTWKLWCCFGWLKFFKICNNGSFKSYCTINIV
jgi:NADH:ubiquinone oxidoreductase subunit H